MIRTIPPAPSWSLRLTNARGPGNWRRDKAPSHPIIRVNNSLIVEQWQMEEHSAVSYFRACGTRNLIRSAWPAEAKIRAESGRFIHDIA